MIDIRSIDEFIVQLSNENPMNLRLKNIYKLVQLDINKMIRDNVVKFNPSYNLEQWSDKSFN